MNDQKPSATAGNGGGFDLRSLARDAALRVWLRPGWAGRDSMVDVADEVLSAVAEALRGEADVIPLPNELIEVGRKAQLADIANRLAHPDRLGEVLVSAQDAGYTDGLTDKERQKFGEGVRAERKRITDYLVSLIGRHRDASRKHRWRDAIAMNWPDDNKIRYLTGLISVINEWDDAMARSYINVVLGTPSDRQTRP